ncbi:MAG: hypothetical protein AB7T09_16115 [Planctomycetota bacterium]
MRRVSRSSLALAGLLLLPGVAGAQGRTDYDAAEGLYAAGELLEGGHPLAAQLFAKGWPTDEAHKKLTQELSAAPADALLQGYLASGFGPSVAQSDYFLSRRELRTKSGDSFESNDDLLGDDLRVFRHLSGYGRSTASFRPPLFPFAQGKRELRGSASEDDLRSLAWRDGQGKHTLEALGMALVLETRYAWDELLVRRTETQSGKEVTLWGRDPRSGFLALVALEAAAAKVWELRTQLIYDARSGAIGPKRGLRNLDVHRYVFPQSWTSTREGDILKHTLADSDGGKEKSRLRAQAAVLLGASLLARLSLDSGDRELNGLFGQQSVRNQKVFLFHPDLRQAVVEVATFCFESLRTIHVRVAGDARASTLADPDRGPGATITPSDLGLFLVAIEEFLKIPSPRSLNDKDLISKLSDEQSKARALCLSLGRFMAEWVSPRDPGAYDKYDAQEGSRAGQGRSLLSQGMLIRGLVAGHRVTHPGKNTSPLLQAARDMVRLVDERFWNQEAGAYCEISGAKRAELFGAAALLGGLRELALETGDGRYLLRYRQFLQRLHGSGWYEPASGNTPAGLLPETSFTQNK